MSNTYHKRFKGPHLSKDLYIDTLVIRGLKYAKDARLTDVFEIERIPYEFYNKIQQLKVLKRLHIHKIHSTNFPVLRNILTKHGKGLQDLIHYGLEHKKQVEILKKKIWHYKELALDTNSVIQWKSMAFQRNLEKLSITIHFENDTLKIPQLKALNSKALHLGRLRVLNIQGNCEMAFDKIFTAFGEALCENKSLSINLLSVRGFVMTDIHIKSSMLNLFTQIKSIKTSFESENQIMSSILENAGYLNSLQSLSGLIQPTFSDKLSHVRDLHQLQDLHLYFYHMDLATLRNALQVQNYPQSLKNLEMYFSCISAETIEHFIKESQGQDTHDHSYTLTNLESLKYTIRVNPYFSSEHLEPFLTIGGTSKLEHLEINCEDFHETMSSTPTSQEAYSFTRLHKLLDQSFCSLKKLTLLVPRLSFSDLAKRKDGSLNIEEIALECSGGIQGIEGLNGFLQCIDPSQVTSVDIGKQIIEKEEDFIDQLNILKGFSKVKKLKLSAEQRRPQRMVVDTISDLLDKLEDLQYVYISFGAKEKLGYDAKQKMQKRMTDILMNEGFANIEFFQVE